MYQANIKKLLVDPAVFELDMPILSICDGLQEIAWHHGKNATAGADLREARMKKRKKIKRINE